MLRLLLMTLACLMIMLGISGLWMMPRVIQEKIEQRIQLKMGTKTFDRFTKVPIAITVKYYLFNITNSEQVLRGLERPVFEEVGPFVYKQWRRRSVVDFEDNNRKVRYKETKTYYSLYEEQQRQQQLDSIGHNSDTGSSSGTRGASTTSLLDPSSVNVTLINLPLLSVLTQLAHLDEGSLKRSLAAMVAKNLIRDGREKILVTRPASQFLFDGYKVGLMESATDLISETLGYHFDSPLPQNKFGFFYGKNGTWSRREVGELTVYTGRNGSMKDFMIVDNWNDLKQLGVWPANTEAGNRCNQIRGTDGSQFHPGVTRDQVLWIFSPLICTSIYIKYVADVSVRDIPLLRFGTPPEVFAAPRKTAANACYCTLGSANAISSNRSAIRRSSNRCYLDGLMDLSLCQRGAPVAVSAPHFQGADPSLAMAAGLKPNKSLHETYLDIEPMTGAVFRAASRAQMNAFVEQSALDMVDSDIIGHMAPMVAPMLWLEEAAEIDEKSSHEFKGQLLSSVQKINRSCILLIVVGILVVLAVSIQYWYVYCYRIDFSPKRKGARASRRRDGHLEANIRQMNMRGGRPLNKLAESSSSKSPPVSSLVAALLTSKADAKQSMVDQDEQLSKEALVKNEWGPSSSSSGQSGGQPPGQVNPGQNISDRESPTACKPGTSKGDRLESSSDDELMDIYDRDCSLICKDPDHNHR